MTTSPRPKSARPAQRNQPQDDDADRKQRNLIEVRNLADNMLYTALLLQQDNGEKIPKQNQLEIEQAVSALRAAMQKDDADTISTLTESLDQILQRAGSFLYTNDSPGPVSASNSQPYSLDGLN